jgi:hypothetical protein
MTTKKSATGRGKRKGITLVPSEPDRIEIRFTALERQKPGPAWDAMWDMLIAKLTPYALAIAEQEQRHVA